MFDISKDQLRQLTDTDLREFLARLCEAEIRRVGAPVSGLKWGGAQTTPDEGLDVEFRYANQEFAGDFVPRARTAFQVKKSSMTPSKIADEMSPNGNLRPIFSEMAADNACYIIVSLADDPTGRFLENRRATMQAQIKSVNNLGDLRTEFYGRADLANWLRQHPGVGLWVRERLGLPLNGWRPFGRWSKTPLRDNDTLICEAGVVIALPDKPSNKLDIPHGIDGIRQLVRDSGKAVRIAGLSGVGKTRIVQALFEDTVGTEPLDKSQAIYTDLGESPDPSARAVLERLIADRRSAIIILDNCPSGTHNQLAADVAAVPHIRLITVEYDIREDKPEETRVVRINTEGLDVAETLVKRRYPGLGQINAYRIAEFSGGNARLALALADAVRDEGSLSTFSDQQLFERLFYQRGIPDANLMMAAEVLALVYSFSIHRNENGVDELAALAALLGQDRRELHRAAQTLVDRQLAQKRGNWRAILPHAVSNRLASQALENVPIHDILETFQHLPNARLLKSFGRRIGYLHDHAISRSIVKSWMSPGGLLSDLSRLNEDGIQLLVNVSPVAPEDVLNAMEVQVVDRTTNTFVSLATRHRFAFVNLLALIAYDNNHFERCVSLLAKFALAELDPETHSRDRLVGLFSLYRSGTEADPATRERVVRRYLVSGRRNQQRLGMGMLKAALQSDHWPSSDSLEFGARPRSHGYRPKSIGEQDDWFFRFLTLAKEIAIADDIELADDARKLVANELRGLWNYPALRKELVAMANVLNNRRAWLQGWRAVRAIKYFDYRKTDTHSTPDGVELLVELEEMLRPQQLADEVRTYVLSTGHERFTLDDDLDIDDSNKWEKSSRRAAARAHELGMAVAHNPMDLLKLSRDIFMAPSGYFAQFGQGLAEQSNDLHTLWSQLVEWIELTGDQTRQCGVMVGFLQSYHERDSKVVSELLDTAVESPILRRFIVDLHTSIPLNHKSVQRLMRSLDYQDTPLRQFESIAWRTPFDVLSEADVRDLMTKVMNKPDGPEVVLEGLGMRLHGLNNEQQTLSPVIRSLGLAASAAQLRSAANVHYGPMHEHHLSKILEYCMDDDQFPEDSGQVLEAYFLKLKASSGYLGTIEKIVPILAENATFGFLDGIFLDAELDDDRRNMVFREKRRQTNPLYNIDASKLLNWCRQDNFQERLRMVAHAIYPFVKETKCNRSVFSKQALAIIESTQDPLEALRVLSGSVRPNGWSGSRANIIADRRYAFERLLEHDRLDIRAAAKLQIDRIQRWEDEERRRERAYDEQRKEREQRFE